MSIFHVGLPEVRFRVWGWEVIPAGAGRVGRQCFHPKLHRNCAGRDRVIMACSVCCSFCFTSLLHQEISLFPLHATKNSIWAASVTEIWVFSASPRQSLLWRSWVGKAAAPVRAGGQRGHRGSPGAGLTPTASQCPDSEKRIVMTSEACTSAQ